MENDYICKFRIMHGLNPAALLAQAKVSTHATYGTLVHDFGYKQVYAASVAHLAQMKIWEKQRVLSYVHCAPVCPYLCMQILTSRMHTYLCEQKYS